MGERSGYGRTCHFLIRNRFRYVVLAAAIATATGKLESLLQFRPSIPTIEMFQFSLS